MSFGFVIVNHKTKKPIFLESDFFTIVCFKFLLKICKGQTKVRSVAIRFYEY